MSIRYIKKDGCIVKKIYLLIPVLLLLVGCSPKLTEEYLVGGHWIPISSYEDGEEVGEPKCIPLDEGMEFKKDDIVFVEAFERDFEYILSEEDSNVIFRDTGPDLDPKADLDYGAGYFRYDIKITSDNEMILMGLGLLEGYNCTMERVE